MLQDADFDELREIVDQMIDADPHGRGLQTGFGLAGEFLVRGLLELVEVDLLWRMEGRKYRGRWVLPDPTMPDFEFKLAQQ